MLLYLHFPFCRSKCAYCSFFSRPYDGEEAALYVQTLLEEIELWGRRLERPRMETAYMGGGTPSLLPLKILERIVATLQDNFQFDDNLEFSFEANPESARNVTYLRQLRDLGINRLSLGVQSLDNNVLFVLGRPHTSRDAMSAADAARRAGFTNLNIDLLWGLPSQRAATWIKQLQVATELGPTHLSCYGLTLEPGTPMDDLVKHGHLALPEENEQARMFLNGAEFLEEKGFLQYEISNFARMGFTCRHNQGYWQGEDYLGLGPAAVSTMGNRRWENPRDLEAYARAVAGNTLETNVEILSEKDKTTEFVMLGLRTARGIDLKEYTARTGRNFLKEHAHLIPLLRRRDLIRIRDGHFRLTREGMLLSNAIMASLFPDED